MLLFRIREYLAASLWFFPALFVFAAILLAEVTTRIDRRYDETFGAVVFPGGVDTALTMLSTIASSMITFTALVFTITIVVLQLASQQFSARILRTFIRDRNSQFALGIFLATFVFALTSMRVVDVGTAEGATTSNPTVSVATAFFLVLVSLGTFVHYINHMSNSVRVSNLVAAVGRDTRAVIDRWYPADRRWANAVDRPTGEPLRSIAAPQPGVLLAIDQSELVDAATQRECTLVLRRKVGDFVPEGEALVDVYGPGDIDDEVVLRQIGLGNERTMEQDPAFGLRQLVDVAEKALSPSLNDPTTAVQAIDQIHDVLRQLAQRPYPPDEHADEEGSVRLVAPKPTWEDFLHLAIDEIRLYASHSIQVARRLQAMLADLLEVARPDRISAIDEETRLLEAMVMREFPDPRDRREALVGDEQGIGG